jgi:ubiquinone/menaquinone biosynthesis C-methylase UbiE
MSFFKRPAPVEPLAVTMAGVTLGKRVLIVGARDTALAAALAAKAGLTGRACVVDADDDRVKFAALAIEREGVLAEVATASWETLPYDAGAFDIAVVRDVLMALADDLRSRAAGEILRVLRPGGRVLIIEAAQRAGFGALRLRPQIDGTYASSGGAPNALSKAGFAAVRELAERDGIRYVEGVKKA